MWVLTIVVTGLSVSVLSFWMIGWPNPLTFVSTRSTPFAVMNDSDRRVSVVLDEALMHHERVNCHPLVNTMTTSIKRADLLRFLEATGHPPRIVALAEQEAPAPS